MPSAGVPPLIGVTTYRQTTSWWSWTRDAALVPGVYLDMVEVAGGQPVLIPPPGDLPPGGASPRDLPPDGAGPDRSATARSRADRLVAGLDGLLLIGGGDLDAARYGQDPDPRNGGTSGARDEIELALVAAALERDLPLLAVCRGLQVLNVLLGGDLIQQLPDRLGSTAHQPRPGAFGAVAVKTEDGSAVRTIFGDRAEVLCSHHQAVGTLGRGLVATAVSEDGVVEAVELPGRRFVVGVQWHPEETGDRRLFDALVAAARDAAPRP